MRQEALQSILISPRRSTVAPVMQPSLSASSGVALMHSTIICSRSACCLRMHAYRRMHPPEAAICEAAWPIDPPGLEAAQHLLKWSSLPSSRLLRLPLSSALLCPKEQLIVDLGNI